MQIVKSQVIMDRFPTREQQPNPKKASKLVKSVKLLPKRPVSSKRKSLGLTTEKADETLRRSHLGHWRRPGRQAVERALGRQPTSIESRIHPLL